MEKYGKPAVHRVYMATNLPYVRYNGALDYVTILDNLLYDLSEGHMLRQSLSDTFV